MVSVNPEDLPEVVASVTRWPIRDRIKLAQQILQTVEDSTTVHRTPVGQRMTAEGIANMVGFTGTPPTDEECDAIIEEHRIRKYGG